MENNQSAARAAKRFLDERTRTDWAYPDVPAPWEHSDEEVRHATDFRERYYGDSESSDSDREPRAAAHDAYKFDSPDAIADAVDRTRGQRRARRRKRLVDEMAENEGLRVWVERRDAWTGAASVRKYGAAAAVKSPGVAQHDSGNGALDSMQSGAPTDTTDSNTTDKAYDLCPVAPRLLPSNPIRASISPAAYPDMYTKIVAASRTPAVPIPLADMTRALVHGWQAANEWPPKQGAVDPLAGRKRAAVQSQGSGSPGFIHRHPHLEKGVGSVRKILHLSGHHGEGAREG